MARKKKPAAIYRPDTQPYDPADRHLSLLHPRPGTPHELLEGEWKDSPETAEYLRSLTPPSERDKWTEADKDPVLQKRRYRSEL